MRAKGTKDKNHVQRYLHKIREKVSQKRLNTSPIIRLNILSILVGIVGGIGSWIFRLAIDFVYYIFFEFPIDVLNALGLNQINWIPFLIAPTLGGLFVGILTSKVSKETKGHGVPEVLEAVTLHNGRMSLRVPFIKIIASATTIGTGGSAGREGPIAQIGAGFASLLGQKLKLSPKEIRTLVISGVGAGISATFNAPIGGSLFAIEILVREGGATTLFVPIIVASVIGVVVGRIFLGTDAPAFVDFPQLVYHDPSIIPFVIILGLICGLLACFWINIFYKGEDTLETKMNKLKIPEMFHPMLGGLFVGIILVITYILIGEQWESYSIMGRTYLPMEMVFSNSFGNRSTEIIIVILFVLLLLKIIATILSIGSGGSGGVFAPTLFIGVMVGAIFGLMIQMFIPLSVTSLTFWAIVGMASFFAGTGRAPLTAIIMTAEMTNDYFLTIPLMIGVASSWLIANHFEKDDIYVRKLTRRGVVLIESYKDLLDTITVEETMIPVEKLITIDKKTRLEKVLDIVRETQYEGFPVVENGRFIGIITLFDIQRALHQYKPKNWIVGDVMEKKRARLVCTDKSASLSNAIKIMEKEDISRLPVVIKDESSNPKLIGWITNHDITRKYVTKKAEDALEETEKHIFLFYNDQK